MSTASAVRTGARALGDLFITVGLVMLLFVAYQLLWTNVVANRAMDRVSDGLAEAWERPPTATGADGADGADGATGVGRTDLGKGFALLRIPRLRGDFEAVPVIEGVQLPQLAKGVGHYPESAGPGELGNFAIAGHRATNGEPFRNMDRMQKGDKVVVETRNRWFTYVVDRTLIVLPTDVWVVDPVPGRPQAEPTKALLTLTTCNPRWASTERLIIFTSLESEQAKSAGRPAALVAKGA